MSAGDVELSRDGDPRAYLSSRGLRERDAEVSYDFGWYGKTVGWCISSCFRSRLRVLMVMRTRRKHRQCDERQRRDASLYV